MVMIGTKADLIQERQVSIEQANSFAKERGIVFLETSAKSNMNVQSLFQDIANKLYTIECTTGFHTKTKGNVRLSGKKKRSKRKK